MARKTFVDCATGQVTARELTSVEDAVLAAEQRTGTQHFADLQAAAAQRQADLALLKAYAADESAHPVFAALARLLGAL